MIPLPPASLRRRILGFLIDVSVGVGLWLGLLWLLSEHTPDSFTSSAGPVFVVYYLVTEGLFGASLGKFIVGTRVVTWEYSKGTFLQIVWRTMVRFLGPIDGVLLLFGRTTFLHDVFSKTQVVLRKVPKSPKK